MPRFRAVNQDDGGKFDFIFDGEVEEKWTQCLDGFDFEVKCIEIIGVPTMSYENCINRPGARLFKNALLF